MLNPNVTGNRALEAAISRTRHLPFPIDDANVVLCCNENYHDAYGDNPYVDCPYDDYQDNVTTEDD